MKILHISKSTEGYESVTLVANRVNRTNSLAVIEREDGRQSFTGGFLLNDTPEIRAALDMIPRRKQYEFVKTFKCVKFDPFVRPYLEEEYDNTKEGGGE